jgi:hypothetical protein
MAPFRVRCVPQRLIKLKLTDNHIASVFRTAPAAASVAAPEAIKDYQAAVSRGIEAMVTRVKRHELGGLPENPPTERPF